MKQKVLIVDDSPFIRRVLTDWLKGEDDFQVVGTASNGKIAIELVEELSPDIITMDVEMPICDGLTALKEIMAKQPTPVLMVSSVTKEGAEHTLQALEYGALDFVTKPNGGASFEFVEHKEEFLSKLRGLRLAKVKRMAKVPKRIEVKSEQTSDQIVLIASSTGGPKALTTLFTSLPRGFRAPICIVQHMPSGFTASLAKRLSYVSPVPVREAEQGDFLQPGEALLAPGGQHLKFDATGKISLTNDASIHGVRPAADYMFKTASQVFGRRCLGVILTGMGRDGADGLLQIKNAGGMALGESESSCVVYGMPKAAFELGAIDAEFKIEEMAQAIVASIQGRSKRAS